MQTIMLTEVCNSLIRHNLVHKPIPIPQAMKISDTKAAVDEEWDIFEELASMARTQSVVLKIRNGKEVPKDTKAVSSYVETW